MSSFSLPTICKVCIRVGETSNLFSFFLISSKGCATCVCTDRETMRVMRQVSFDAWCLFFYTSSSNVMRLRNGAKLGPFPRHVNLLIHLFQPFEKRRTHLPSFFFSFLFYFSFFLFSSLLKKKNAFMFHEERGGVRAYMRAKPRARTLAGLEFRGIL